MDNDFIGGEWTKQKLEILRRYLDAYTTALKEIRYFRLTYVDAFAGDGRKSTDYLYTDADYRDFDKMWDGSPRIALNVKDKPFDRLVFIEKDANRVKGLHKLENEYSDRNIHIINDDANRVLPSFCGSLKDNDRAVVFLDPFATQVSWKTVSRLAETAKIDCWILFPLSAIARMMPTDKEPLEMWEGPLDRIFGESKYWHDLYQEPQQRRLLPDNEPSFERLGGSDMIAAAYRSRLKEVFCEVAPTRRTLKNSRKAPMFELFFAASNPVGASLAIRMADHILKNW